VPRGFTVNLFAEGLNGVATWRSSRRCGVCLDAWRGARSSGSWTRTRRRGRRARPGGARRVWPIPLDRVPPATHVFRRADRREARLDPGADHKAVTLVSGLAERWPHHPYGRLRSGQLDVRRSWARRATCATMRRPRAAVTRYNLNGLSPHTSPRVSGFRWPGLQFRKRELWANTNDRDNLGDDTALSTWNILEGGEVVRLAAVLPPGQSQPRVSGSVLLGRSAGPRLKRVRRHSAPLGLAFLHGPCFRLTTPATRS